MNCCRGPQFSPALPGSAVTGDGWVPAGNLFNGDDIVEPVEGSAAGKGEVPLVGDGSGNGVPPDNGALIYGIVDTDPNDDPGGVPVDFGGGGD